MADILHNLNRYTTTVAVADALDHDQLIRSPEFANVYDPHIWFDVMLWIQVVGFIRDQLINHDPDHTTDYQKNADAYIQQLHHLDTYVRHHVATLPPDRRILVTAHDAFGYFGRAYGFKVVGLQGISTESETSMHDIHQLVTYILAHRIPAIFVEASIPHRTIQAVHEALAMHNWHITVEPELCSDALGSPDSMAKDYTGMITYNSNAIVAALHS